MQNVTCQDHIADAFQQALTALRSVSIHDRSDIYFLVRDALASVLNAHFMRTCEPGFIASSFRPYVLQFLEVADQLDAVPDIGADPDLIVEAAASLRLLCCLLDSAESVPSSLQSA